MCKLCEKEPVYEFTNKRKLCKNCFIHWFEKKFLYTARKFKLFSLGEKVSFKYEGDFSSVVLKNCLFILEKGSRISLLKQNLKKGFDKFALNSTLDDESYEFILSLLNNKFSNKNLLPTNGKIVRPLYLFLDKEVKLYADLKKLKYSLKKRKENEWTKFIGEMEKLHPELKQATMQSYLKLSLKEEYFSK